MAIMANWKITGVRGVNPLHPEAIMVVIQVGKKFAWKVVLANGGGLLAYGMADKLNWAKDAAEKFVIFEFEQRAALSSGGDK